jgi:hypothetical protein
MKMIKNCYYRGMKLFFILLLTFLCFSCGVSIKSTKYSSVKLNRLSVFIYFTEDLLIYSEGISQELQDTLKKMNIPVNIDLIYHSKSKTKEQKNDLKERRTSVVTESINNFNPNQILYISTSERNYVNGILDSVTYILTITDLENAKIWQAKMFIATASVEKMKKVFSTKLFEKLKMDGLL